MKVILPTLYLLLLVNACSKSNKISLEDPTILLTKVSNLPSELIESSGLEMDKSGNFWSHNDRGNKAELYVFNKNGQLTRIVEVDGSTNNDWEDLTEDAAGNLYIGDFGNNDNDRQNLAVYKISSENLRQNNNKILSEKIQFTFEDQLAFPPDKTIQNFDVEAMFTKADFLYLLTKDRSKPFTGTTKLYRLPNTIGSHKAVLLGDFKTDDNKNKGQITAADISPDGSKLTMLANETIWIFSDFIGENFFSGKVKRIDLSLELQLESIVFQDDCTLYLTNEKTDKEPANLYEIDSCL